MTHVCANDSSQKYFRPRHVHSTYIHVHAVLFTSDFNSHSIPGHPLTISLNTLTMLCHAVPTYSNSTLPNWALQLGLAWKAALYPSGIGAIFTIEASLVRTPLWPMWVYMGPGLLLGLMGHDGGTKVVGFFLLRPLALLSGPWHF